jgi:hypothetical protein
MALYLVDAFSIQDRLLAADRARLRRNPSLQAKRQTIDWPSCPGVRLVGSRIPRGPGSVRPVARS